MTLTEIVYDIREKISETVDDSDITDRYIIFEFNAQRELMLKNEFNKNHRAVDIQYQQSFCVDMEVASASDCNCDDLTCGIMRTVKQMPMFVRLHGGPLITRVGPYNDRSALPFSYVDYNRAIRSGYDQFTEDTVYAFLYTDGRIYLKSGNKLVNAIQKLNISGVFANPLDANNYDNCNITNANDPCFDPVKTRYPITGDLYVYIREQVIEQLLRKLAKGEDLKNDSALAMNMSIPKRQSNSNE